MAEQRNSPEVWGGVECTINRVDDTYFDQYARSGHRVTMAADLQRIAALGVRALRVGLHWEHFEATRSWTDFDRMLGKVRELGIRPIAGLLHHGSGPPGVDLLHPEFPERLAEYALTVAQRYPWLMDYTPVNEPQTTSRFSCLYGHWYPHHRSVESYARALVNEIKGIVLAMRAIRTVQPEARLIHTEDGGATYATAELEAFRVEREHRRWLGTDLLCGRVDAAHTMFEFLTRHGVAAVEVLWFRENVCPPDVLGLNYYVTSDRFLDHRMELYPDNFPGGDTGSEPLVDIEAVRVRSGDVMEVETMLLQAWRRYGLPVAITEAHLGGAQDDQVRWLAEVWRGARAARAAGADVRAVTVWALLGLWNWCNLCTEDVGLYEPGVFDTPTGELRVTPLVELVEQMARGEEPKLAVLEAEGWWRLPERFVYPRYPVVMERDRVRGDEAVAV